MWQTEIMHTNHKFDYLYMMVSRLTNHNQSNVSILHQHKQHFGYFRINHLDSHISKLSLGFISDLHVKFAVLEVQMCKYSSTSKSYAFKTLSKVYVIS